MQEYDISKKVEYVENSASLIVLTDKRWLRMSLGEFEYSRRIRISDNKSFLGRWLAGEKRKFEWYFIPKELHVYSKKLNAKQYIASQIKVVLLSEIQITGRYEFTLKDGSSTPPSQIHLLTLNLGQLVSYSFKQNDGSRIHQLLQLSSVNNGHIPLVSRDTVNLKNNLSSVDNLEKLKQLKLMLDNGLITEQEYQSKKQELLLRM